MTLQLRSIEGRFVLIPVVLRLLLLLVLLGAPFGCGAQQGKAASEESIGDAVTTEESTHEQTNQLTIKEAVGQMFMVGMSGTEPDYYITKMIKERDIGGVILTGPNIESLDQTQALVSELQKLSTETSSPIPLLIAVDEEGGSVTRAPWIASHPAAALVGQSRDPEWANQIAKDVGQNLKEAGINTNLAPVVDAGLGAAIGDRSYGTDPNLVSRMGAATIEGFEGVGMVSAAKHFPNHGPADQDSHVGSPIIEHDMSTIETQDLPPFKAAIDAGVPMVMVGHLIYPAIDPALPTSLSPRTIRLLREDLGFNGVIITDDLNMEGATRGGTVAQAAVEAISAGADMLLLSAQPQDQAEAYEAVEQAVQSGEISREQINQSVGRILRLKEEYGIFKGTSKSS